MPYTIDPLISKKQKIPSFHELLVPIDTLLTMYLFSNQKETDLYK